MIAIDGLLGLALLGFWLWALIDCVASPRHEVRNLPKLLWVLLIVLFWVFGAAAWAFLGRTPRARRLEPPERPLRLDDFPSGPPVGSVPARPQPMSDARSAELDRQIEAWEAERRSESGGGRDRGPQQGDEWS